MYLLEEEHCRGVGDIGEVHGGLGLVQQAEGWGRGHCRGFFFSIFNRGRRPPQGCTPLHHPLLQEAHTNHACCLIGLHQRTSATLACCLSCSQSDHPSNLTIKAMATPRKSAAVQQLQGAVAAMLCADKLRPLLLHHQGIRNCNMTA